VQAAANEHHNEARKAMAHDSVEKNYNDKGTIIMEMIYADDYLSPGALHTTQSLVEFGAVSNGLKVLDIGSGVGGAGFHLAESKDCSVVGVDLVQSNVADANRRARDRGLSNQARFMFGNATALPFVDEKFDLVCGQDAWCHVDDKAQLFSEAARVLVTKGSLVFSDWLLRDAQSSLADQVRDVTSSPYIADTETYKLLLDAHGFEQLEHHDNTVEFVARYHEVIMKMRALESEICSRFGTRIYEIVLEKQQFVCDAFDKGILASGYFRASRS
jgi:ubiquinone/menaquinone biosynthesis C-methylase UbiE